MKKLLLFAIVITTTIIFPISLLSRAIHEDVIYLKSGTIVRGKILELTPNQSVKILTKDNVSYGYTFDVIDKIIKDPEPVTPPKEPTEKSSTAPEKPDHSSQSNIYKAVYHNDLEKVQELINSGENVNEHAGGHCFPLMIAVLQKNKVMVDLLSHPSKINF